MKDGEWVADGVLAYLGSESGMGGSTSTAAATAGSSSVAEAERASLPLSSTDYQKDPQPVGYTGLGQNRPGTPLLQLYSSNKSDSVPPARQVNSLNSGTGSRGIPPSLRATTVHNSTNNRATLSTSRGTREFIKLYARDQPSGVSGLMLLPQRPVSPRYTVDRDRASSFVNNPGPACPPTQSKRSWTRETSNNPAHRPFSGRVNVQSTQVKGGNRSKAPQSIPSQPRAMQMHLPTKTENNGIISGLRTTLNRPYFIPLSHNDLEKWPCRRCSFVHRGGDCEIYCIGCGSKQHDKHEDTCPFKDRIRGEMNTQLRRRAPMPPQEKPLRHKSMDPRVSSTIQLSVECQELGFNPVFEYFQCVNNGAYNATLSIQDVVITCGETLFKTQKDARDALAPKGLELIRKMGQGLSSAGQGRASLIAAKTPTPALNREIPPEYASFSSQTQSSDFQNLSARQSEPRKDVLEGKDHVRNLIKSAQSPQQWGKGSRNSLPSSNSNAHHGMGLSQQEVSKNSVVVELPGNVDSSAARVAVERAVTANPNTNISLHFPANVSVEIARAYGSAINVMATSSRRRSRSRSPVRELERIHQVRNREHDRQRDRETGRRGSYDYRQDRGWSRQQAGSSVWPPRGLIDTYRPSPQAGTRMKAEDSRFRLSPPLESKYYHPHGRKEYGPPGGPAGH